MLWLLALASASPLARAKAGYATSKEDLARARSDAHLWKVRLDDARAEARVAAEAVTSETARALKLGDQVRAQGAQRDAAANATRLALQEKFNAAEARTAELEQRTADERKLAQVLDSESGEAVPAEPEPAAMQRALRGLVKAAERSVPSVKASEASEAEANATALTAEARDADAEVGAFSAETRAVEGALADARANGAALAAAAPRRAVVAEAGRLAAAVRNLTAFEPNRTVPVGGAAALQQALAVPVPEMPDPAALSVLKVQLQAATETRIVDERERQAHLAGVAKLEKELGALSQASSNLASELGQQK